MAALAPPAIRPSLAVSKSTPALPPPSRLPTIQRRSTLKRSHDESAAMDVPQSPSKRLQVKFDPDIEYVSAGEGNDLDPILVREEVRRAIQRHLNGDDETYDQLKSSFSTAPRTENAPSTNTVRLQLQAALVHISSLNKTCNGLVNAILFGEWVGRDEKFYTLYIKFLANLAAAHGGYLGRILSMIVDLLGPQKTRRLPGCPIVREAAIHERVLRGIQYIIQLVPVASNTLLQVIQKKLSFDFATPQERIVYTTNFMKLMGYVPDLKSEILAMITRSLVNLDVSVQVALEDEDDDLSDELLEDVSSSQALVADAAHLSISQNKEPVEETDDGASTTDESEMEDDEELDSEELRRRKIKDDVQQVDAIMDMLFQYYDGLVLSSSLEVRDIAIEQLISHFDSIILPTYRSRHSQFLIFHFAQTSPIFVDRFVTSCISILVDKGLSPVLRQSASAYLAGFVGRGAHVSPTVVKDSFSLLCDELNDLRKEYEPGCRGPDLKRYSNFYAIMQAILYIFCFRWRDIATSLSDMEDDESDEDDAEQYHISDSIRDTLTSAVDSRLNPLRICTPGIVEQFAKIAHQLRFMYLFTKIEANKHVRLSASRTGVVDHDMSRDSSWVGENGMLEGNFPYDPYQLPVSRRWVENDYLEWKGIPGPHDNDSDSDEADLDDDLIPIGENDEDNDHVLATDEEMD